MNTITTRRSAVLMLTMEERLRRCATPLTKWQLVNALVGPNHALSINGIAVLLVGVEREGGKNCYNLTLSHDNKTYKCFVHCQDAA